MHLLSLLAPLFVILAACSDLNLLLQSEIAHRYFKEVDQPGVVAAELFNERSTGRFVRLLEIDYQGRSVGDTLRAWVQHFGSGVALSPEAADADLVVTCYRQLLPQWVRPRHVLPESHDEIYVYAMRGGILVVSSERIPYYEVLMVPGGSVEGYAPRSGSSV